MSLHTKTLRDAEQDMIPFWIRKRFAEFVLDKRTGNLIIHIKSGQVLGGKLEEVLTKD